MESAVNPQTVTRNFLITSFIETFVIRVTVHAMVKSPCLVNRLVWVRLVCQVIFAKLRHPFGSGQGIKVQSLNAQRHC
jgi:hypothetical protein